MLTKDAVKEMMLNNSANQASSIQCDYTLQVVEPYKVQAPGSRMENIICFRLADGYSKLKGLFQKATSHELASLHKNEYLTRFPIIQVTQYKKVGKNTEDNPILVENYRIVDYVNKIIGVPMPFKAYQLAGYKNANGAHELEEIDFDELKMLFGDHTPQPKKEDIKEPEKQKLKIVRRDLNIPQEEKKVQVHIVKAQQSKFQEEKQQEPIQQKSEYFPISMLNPKFQEQFRGRIVQLNELRQYGGKGKKEGVMFTMQILDESMLISATFFDKAAEMFYKMFQVGKVFKFKGVQIKLARNAEQNRQKGCSEYDFIFDHNAQIQQIYDNGEIPSHKFNFKKIEQIFQLPKDQFVDLVCIIRQSSELVEFQPKYKDEKSMRKTFTVYDDSSMEITINIYGNHAKLFNYNPDEIYMFKMLKITEYQGVKNLTSTFQSSIIYNEEDQICQNLRRWQRQYTGDIKECPSQIKSIQQVIIESSKCETDINLKIFSEVRAYVTQIKNNGTLYYLSCINCLKKAVESNGIFSCMSCNIEFAEPRPRYILNCKISDSTSSLWVSIGDSQANEIISISAQEYKILNEQGREKEKINALEANNYQQYKFKIVSKSEQFNDQVRVKHNVNQIVKIGSQDVASMINQIDFYVQNL